MYLTFGLAPRLMIYLSQEIVNCYENKTFAIETGASKVHIFLLDHVRSFLMSLLQLCLRIIFLFGVNQPQFVMHFLLLPCVRQISSFSYLLNLISLFSLGWSGTDLTITDATSGLLYQSWTMMSVEQSV
jgi:hypothetical protein